MKRGEEKEKVTQIKWQSKRNGQLRTYLEKYPDREALRKTGKERKKPSR